MLEKIRIDYLKGFVKFSSLICCNGKKSKSNGKNDAEVDKIELNLIT